MKIIKIGLGYENIHTFVSGCVLFHKILASETKYSNCQEGRYKRGFRSVMVPKKILHHFLLIPQLLQIYRCRDIVELMQCHA